MNHRPQKGKAMLSEPFLEDPNFSRTVVLLTEYGEEGAVGFVLNHRTDLTVDMLMPDLSMVTNPVYNGGPVELESFHYLHAYEQIEGAVDLGNGVFWSGSFEQVIKGLTSGEFDAAHFKFFIGYSGWAEGQLEDELEEQAWLVTEIRKELVFNTEVDNKKLWQMLMQELGGDFALLANSPINPQLN